MSGRIVHVGHICHKPGARNHSTGTIWQCDCGRYWRNTGVEWIFMSSIAVAMTRMAEQMAAAQVRPKAER